MTSSKGFISRKKKEVNLDDGTEIQEHIVDYVSTFDFKSFGVEKEKEKLVKCEEAVVFHKAKSDEHRFKIAEALYSANKTLANKKNGVYVAWCENLGITRNKSSDILNSYNLYLATGKREALSLPVRVVREINKNKDDLDKNNLVEIVGSKKPAETINKIMLHSATLTKEIKEGVQEAEIIESKKEILERKAKELSFIERDIRERERNLKKRYDDFEELKKEIEELKKGN